MNNLSSIEQRLRRALVTSDREGGLRVRRERWNPGWTLGRLNYHRMVRPRWRVTRWSVQVGHRWFVWGPHRPPGRSSSNQKETTS